MCNIATCVLDPTIHASNSLQFVLLSSIGAEFSVYSEAAEANVRDIQCYDTFVYLSSEVWQSKPADWEISGAFLGRDLEKATKIHVVGAVIGITLASFGITPV
jgi:hypothetical protein